MPLTRRDLEVQAPYFAIDGHRVWGATAMILSELLWILGRPVVVPR